MSDDPSDWPQPRQWATVGKRSQTITFDTEPTGVVVGRTGKAVSARASSGLAVAYSSLTPWCCTVDPSSGALTTLVAGTCTIAANQAGNDDWNAAPQATQTVEAEGRFPEWVYWLPTYVWALSLLYLRFYRRCWWVLLAVAIALSLLIRSPVVIVDWGVLTVGYVVALGVYELIVRWSEWDTKKRKRARRPPAP